MGVPAVGRGDPPAARPGTALRRPPGRGDEPSTLQDPDTGQPGGGIQITVSSVVHWGMACAEGGGGGDMRGVARAIFEAGVAAVAPDALITRALAVSPPPAPPRCPPSRR